MLKNKLLELGFIDNNFLDEYVKLISNAAIALDAGTSKTVIENYAEFHHAIPVACYTTDYTNLYTDSNIQAVRHNCLQDNENFLVKLSYSDHFYAHWLLFNCTTNRLKAANAKAVLAMSGNVACLNFSLTAIKKFKSVIKKELDGYWTEIEDSKLIAAYHRNFSHAEVSAFAASIDKTPGAVKTRICRLKLSSRSWSTEDEQWLTANYEALGAAACAQFLNRSLSAIEHKVTRLDISTRAWSKEQEQWLIANYKLLGAAACARQLNKSVTAVKSKVAAVKSKFCANNPNYKLAE